MLFFWKSGIRLHCFRSRFTTSRSVEFCEVIPFRALKIEITIRVHPKNIMYENREKMLESRPKDALVKLVKPVKPVKLVKLRL